MRSANLKAKKLLLIAIAIGLLLTATRTSSPQSSNGSSIKLPSGETLTAREVQDLLNQSNTVAELYLIEQQRCRLKDEELTLERQKSAFLQSQIDEYEKVVKLHEAAAASLQEALAAAKEGNKLRDQEIEMYKQRVAALEKKKTSLWKKVLLVAAGIVVGRGL